MAHSHFTATALYPPAPEQAIKDYYLGKELKDVQAPAVVIDQAIARRNCERMLNTATKLKVNFRAHVKTHKTTQLAKLQVGRDANDIRLIVSTVAEAENLVPWLKEAKEQGRKVNILYGLPVAPSAVPRLAQIAGMLGEDSVSVLVDHQDQVKVLNAWPHGTIAALPKIDVGYHRAGVVPGTSQFRDLAQALAESSKVRMAGFYAHMGHSYGVGSPDEALKFFVDELKGLADGANEFLAATESKVNKTLVLSLGASPTATATQNLALNDNDASRMCAAQIEKIKESFTVEIHAGVYPLLDMQQLATRARPDSLLAFSDLGLRVLVEVASVYHNREKPEALIAAGSIVLGREPCKSYPGWGVVSSWPSSDQVYDPEADKTGWIVGSISQEHGVLRWEGSKEKFRPLNVGDKLLVYPNHACMAGPNFGFYLVVDTSRPDKDVVVDIWTRCRGW